MQRGLRMKYEGGGERDREGSRLVKLSNKIILKKKKDQRNAAKV